MLTKIFDMAFELEGDFVTIEQDGGCGEVDRVQLHRSQLAFLLQEAGLIQRAPSGDVVTRRMARQLRVLHERIDKLNDWIREKAGLGREDLDAECIYSLATWEMSRLFVEELDEALDGERAGKPETISGLREGDTDHVRNECGHDADAAARNPITPPAAPKVESDSTKHPHDSRATATPNSNAERQRRYRERKRNANTVTPAARNARVSQLELKENHEQPAPAH